MTKTNTKSIMLAFAATMVRYYDYGLFGLSAAMIADHVMPADSADEQLLKFYGVFSLAVILRPLGTVVFGNIGDKIGRVSSVKIATILAAIATIAIGLVPSYETVGVVSIIVLTVARTLFLVSLAGEIDAIKIYIVEIVGKRKRFFASSLVTLSAQIGVLMAAYLYSYASEVDQTESDSLIRYWQLNFIGGGVFGLIIFALRRHLIESELFLKSKARIDVFDDMRLHNILLKHKLLFALAMVISGMLGGIYNFLIIFLANFAGHAAGYISPMQAASMNIKLVAIYGLASVASGVLADRIGYFRQVFTALVIVLITLLGHVFILGGEYSPKLHKMLVFIVPFFMVPTYIKIQSLFVIKVRMRMVSLAHSLGSMLFSASAPVLSMLLWKYNNSFSSVISFFMLQIVVILLSILVIYKMKFIDEFESDQS